MSGLIPLSVPNFMGNEKKYVMDAVDQGWVSTGGAYINIFEEELARYLNIERVVACQSGTSALHLAVIECGIKPGDMVIVPTLTFIAAVNPVRYQFADPIFMDCDDSLCMDPVKLEKFCREECELTEDGLIYKVTGQCIRAVIVVHVFGNMADMEKIMEIALANQLLVIEDATEALGSRYIKGRYKGCYAGTIGDYGAFSFNGNKIITTGGGGALVARHKQSLLHAKYISTQAKDDELLYTHNEVGYNYRMTNVQAALGVAQLECLEEFIKRKNYNYNLYCKHISTLSIGRLMSFREDVYSNKWFYAFELLCDSSKSIKDIVKELEERSVQTRPLWGLIHQQNPYQKFVAYDIEKAEYFIDKIINIPCSTDLQEEDIWKVVKSLKHVLE